MIFFRGFSTDFRGHPKTLRGFPRTAKGFRRQQGRRGRRRRRFCRSVVAETESARGRSAKSMFSFLLSCLCAPPSLSLPLQSLQSQGLDAPPNSLVDEEPVEGRWDMMATALLVHRLYAYRADMLPQWEQEQLEWLTEMYGSPSERVVQWLNRIATVQFNASATAWGHHR